ncbi:hypothetical protein GCM10023196_104670 [Actinoallomurus vinaceus]|uniref:DUF4870 domain-containing protein n=1 Tax=Actinoallomurus vinaceus TaxID=1080074 RepID=A0ABP8UU13_9ACTN
MTDPSEPSPEQQPPAGSPGFTPPGPQPYGAPPPPYGPGGYPPPYGQGAYPPPYGQQGDDTMWPLLAYLGQLTFGFVAPLVVYLARRDQSPFTRFHSAQALNAALSYVIVVSCGVAVAFTSLPAKAPVVAILAIVLMFVFAVVQFIYLIIAAVKAGRREMYRLPTWLCWRMVR